MSLGSKIAPVPMVDDEFFAAPVSGEEKDGVFVPDPESGFSEAEKIYWIPVSQISPDSEQPRKGLGDENGFSPEKMESFAQSIREARAMGHGIGGTGIEQPLIVRRGPMGRSGRVKYILHEGERRWRTAQMIGLSDLPCIVRDMNSSESFLRAVRLGIQREDFTPLETGLALRAYMNETGMSIRKCAAHFGKEKSWVENRLNLIKMGDDAQQSVTKRADTIAIAQIIDKVSDPTLRQHLINLAIEGVSEKEIRTVIKKQTGTPQPDKAKTSEVKADEKLQKEKLEELGNLVTTDVKGNPNAEGETVTVWTGPLDRNSQSPEQSPNSADSSPSQPVLGRNVGTLLEGAQMSLEGVIRALSVFPDEIPSHLTRSLEPLICKVRESLDAVELKSGLRPNLKPEIAEHESAKSAE